MKVFNKTFPVVSVITVVYNGAALLEQTILSVLNLEYPGIEYIIIDGGSTDGSIDIIEKYKSRIAYFVSEPDEGIYDAMNKGIKVASGDWINFMNCGDKFASTTALNIFEHHVSADVDVIYGDAIIKYCTFETTLKTIPIEQFWKRMPFCHQASFVRSGLIKTYPFDNNYKLSSDFDFLYKMFKMKRKFFYTPTIICHFDFTQGASIKYSLASIEERKRIVLKWGFSLRRWLYYSFYIQYVHLSIFIKKILGKPLAERIIRILNR